MADITPDNLLKAGFEPQPSEGITYYVLHHPEEIVWFTKKGIAHSQNTKLSDLKKWLTDRLGF